MKKIFEVFMNCTFQKNVDCITALIFNDEAYNNVNI